MYYQNYEDYMRSVLGYPIENRDTYVMNNANEEASYNYTQNRSNKEIEEMYPEIYKRVNPVVCEVCDKCNMPLTRDLLENMTDEVFRRIDVGKEFSVKINIDNRIFEKEIVDNAKQMNSNNVNVASRSGINSNNVNITNRSGINSNTTTNNIQTNSRVNSSEPMNASKGEIQNRQQRQNNPFLRDLIQILILNRILGGGIFFPPVRPPRPPFPGPGRPPFPGGPGGRPPMPRDYDEYIR